MKTKSSITVKNRAYPYTLEKKSNGRIRFVSKAAKIDQDFLPEDVSELILDLPNLIIAEQNYSKKQSDVVRFRVSGVEKRKIEKTAIKKGYNSVSSYLKDLALR